MKFTCSTEINYAIEKAVELFDNTDNLKEWQTGFQSHEHISGRPGQPGAKSKITLLNGNQLMELIETVQVNNLPEEKTGLYEHKHMVNTMKSSFIALDKNNTRYDVEIEYTAFYGFLPKMMAFLFPGMFRKQTQKFVDHFKAFAERETDTVASH